MKKLFTDCQHYHFMGKILSYSIFKILQFPAFFKFRNVDNLRKYFTVENLVASANYF
jgi:hypothetical protein